MFEKSSTGLRRWFYAAYLVASTGGALPASELERQLDVSGKTARRMKSLLDAALTAAHAVPTVDGDLAVTGVNLTALLLAGTGPDRRRNNMPDPGAADRYALDGSTDHLPAPPTRFIGRRREILAVRQLLGHGQLVTLAGPGGCGKSRLAVEVGRSLVGAYPDGVWWVALQRLTSGQSVPGAVADALGLLEQPGRSQIDTLRQHLRDRTALIVLDNCEHVLDSSAELLELILPVARQVRIMATSREAIGIGGEAVWRVAPLPIPRLPATLAQVAGFDSVRLFADRANAALASFRLDESNAEAVAQICIHTDGMPLAIELAAAQVPALGSHEIAIALDDSLRLLTRGDRGGLSRHRTLRASMEWSHTLLSDDERVLLRRLAVFPGSFSLAAVKRVCTDDSPADRDVVRILAALVHKSLVAVDASGSTRRYRLLQTVRHYAGERLAEAGEESAVRDRHLAYAIELVEREPTPDLLTERLGDWLDEIEEESGTLRAALDWAIARGDRLEPLRLAAGLGVFFNVRVHLTAGREYFADALAAGDIAPSRERARALWGSAYVAFPSMDIMAARAQATAALEMARAVDDAQTVARALALLGGIALGREPQRAREHLAEAIELARAAGDDWCLAQALGYTSYSWIMQSRVEPARRYGLEAGSHLRRRGALRMRAWHAMVSGLIALRAGELSVAAAEVDQAGVLAADVGDPMCQARTAMYRAEIDCWRGLAHQARAATANLDEEFGLSTRSPTIAMPIHTAAGKCALTLGDLATAEREFQHSLTIARESFAPAQEADSAIGLAEVALLRDRPQRALDLLDRAAQCAEALADDRLAAAVKVRLSRAARADGDRARDLCHEALLLLRDGGHQLEAVTALETLAGLQVHLGDPVHAARLIGAATAARRRLGARRSRLDDLLHRPDRTALAKAVEPATLRAAMRDGAALTVEQAIAYSMRGRGTRARPASGWQSLTPTEIAVATLVAEGRTNPEIAQRMFVSRATVKAHLARIFTKIGLSNRAGLAAEVTRQSAATSRG